MIPLTNAPAAFEQRYNSLFKHLRLKGMQPKTIDAYARAIRPIRQVDRSNWVGSAK